MDERLQFDTLVVGKKHTVLGSHIQTTQRTSPEIHDFVRRLLGSRTALKITNFDGRLPDILFVRKERLGILEWLKLSEAPDLVIELVSPGDRPSDKIELEADYRSIGVPEIVFVDSAHRYVQTFRRQDQDYRIDKFQTGRLSLESIPGFWVDLDWLFSESRPPVHEALSRIEAEA